MTYNIILASIPKIKGRNKKIKVREKNRERWKTKSSFVLQTQDSRASQANEPCICYEMLEH